MNTHVCLVSAQLIPNVLPVLRERPERVVLLVSADMRERGRILERIFRDRGLRVFVHDIPPYDLEGALSVCRGVLETYGADGAVTLNVTGGTKVAALAAYQQFFFDSRRIIYVDTEHDRILELGEHPGGAPLSENLLRVGEYLACCGKRMRPSAEERRGEDEAWRDRDVTARLCRLLLADPPMLRTLNGVMAEPGRSRPPYVVDFASYPALRTELFELLTRSGLARRGEGGALLVETEAVRAYLNGGWLEEHVFNTVRGLRVPGLDCRLNVHVEWRGGASVSREPTTNEHDVLFTHRNRLHVVSCKTSGLDRASALFPKGKEALYELDSLSRNVGGSHARALLVSAHRLRPEDLRRARELDIAVFKGTDLLTLKERLSSYLGLSSAPPRPPAPRPPRA